MIMTSFMVFHVCDSNYTSFSLTIYIYNLGKRALICEKKETPLISVVVNLHTYKMETEMKRTKKIYAIFLLPSFIKLNGAVEFIRTEIFQFN